MIDNKGIFIGRIEAEEKQRALPSDVPFYNMDKLNSIAQEPPQYDWTKEDVTSLAEKKNRLTNVSELPDKPGGPDCVQDHDPVNHPSHYTYGTIETIDYIEDKGQNFNLGNAVKYVSRAGHKIDAIEDLKKAIWYINREIMRLQKEKSHA